MYAGAAGIRKFRIFAFAHFSQHSAGNTVIEEQTGVEIIRQIYPPARIIFALTSKELALLALIF